jgi:rhodanese-related sulfurtransferase
MTSAANIASTPAAVPEISREELHRRLQDQSLTIVDVLPPESYNSAHIPGALSIPLDTLAVQARDVLPDPGAEIVVYCGNLKCDRSVQALHQLQELGYTNVRDYSAGIADWVEAGEPTESLAETAPPMPDPSDEVLNGPPLEVSPDGEVGRVQARVSQMHKVDKSILAQIQQRSALQLFIIWMGMVALCGTAYWLLAIAGEHGLVEHGAPLGVDLNGFASSIYFSFVTATSIGYGDIVPIGFARVIAVIEAVSALLLFGAVIAKFVSHRQDEMMSEIHRVTFEERLDRVQTNLHMVISEMLAITEMCEDHARLSGIDARLDSSALIFLGEMRSVHDLLYQPRLIIEEGALASILAILTSALTVMSELLAHLPPTFVRSQPLVISIDNIKRYAADICSNCVPHGYTPRLVFWMDRIQAAAQRVN